MRKKLLREGFVDDHDLGGVETVRHLEESSGNERDADGAKISGGDDAVVEADLRFLAAHGLGIEPDSDRVFAGTQRQPIGGSGGFDARDLFDRGQKALEKAAALIAIAIGASREGNLHRENVADAVAGIEMVEGVEAARQQTGGRHQYDAQSYLHDHQSKAESLAIASGGAAASAVFEGACKVDLRAAQGRENAEDHGRGKRREQPESQDPGIDPDFVGSRKGMRAEDQEKADTQDRKRKSQRSADERKQRAFDQQMSNQDATAGAHSGADRHFAHPNGAAGEQQARHIRAGDQQNAANGRPED